MRAMNKLTALKIRNVPPGMYSDGGNLWLRRRQDGGAQWILRAIVHGRRREMGLGSFNQVGLKEAREAAEHWRAVIRQGKDPIKERERQRREAAKTDNTLETVATAAFEARKAELKGDGKPGRWYSPLRLHILPKLGRVPIEEIDQRDIRDTLAPIWHTKGETAKKAMDRLGIVMNYGAAMGLDVDIQATGKARALLGKSRQVKKQIPALAWQDVPEFYSTLNEGTVTQLALKLLILTATRSQSVRFAKIEDFVDNTWIIPAQHMKAGKEFRLPISNEVQNVVRDAIPFARDGYLFPGTRKGVISDATMSSYMKRLKIEARPHGFRSSFRTWCAEVTDIPREIAEVALAHAAGGKVELSYRRTDYLERRRPLMEQWAKHVAYGKLEKLQQLQLNIV